jgi:acetyltransferase-like isoleucine patch superfamily enzyme
MIRNFINFVNSLINNYCIKKQHLKIEKSYKFNGTPYIRNFGEIYIGKNFKATSGTNYNPIGGDTILRIICRKDATISIGDNVGISNSTLHIMNSLTIEDNVLIGGSCKIWDTDFHSIDYKERNYNGDNEIISKAIHIKKNAFIGASSIILKGVTIGENSIVGAGSVVTKSIPDNEIWGGNPAKKIKGIINE